MKVILVNGSPHKEGCTYTALQEVEKELNAEGIENINYRLTGFFNGGLWAYMPYNVEVEENVGGEVLAFVW